MATPFIRDLYTYIDARLVPDGQTSSSRAVEVLRRAIEEQVEGVAAINDPSVAGIPGVDPSPNLWWLSVLFSHFQIEDFYGTFEELPQKCSPGALQKVEQLLHSSASGWVSKAGHRMLHGVWDHFKGGVYLTTDTINFVEDDKPLVLYTSLIFGSRHARRAEEWNDLVQWPDGQWRSRFVYRGGTTRTPPPYFKVPSPVIEHIEP